MLTTVRTALLRLWPRARPNPVQGLASPPQFRRLLEHERARVDRGGGCVALIVFAPRAAELCQETHRRLAAILGRRLRSTDRFGWVDAEQLGALLPCTDAAGAWKLADDVCLLFPPDVPPPISTVFLYPEHNSRLASDPAGSAARPVAALDVLLLQPLPWWKRALDVVGASAGLVLLAPLLLLIAVAIKLTSRGPVLFRQLRSGHGNKPFWMIKFRSMVVDAEARKKDLAALNEQDGPAFKIRNDPRTTRLGRFLRRTSLDELPQLWNVLRGDMSLVGPRPLPVAEAQACENWHRRRLDVTPGLTCIWQVRGRSTVTFADWVRMDVEYIRSRSLWQDLKLLVLTVPAVWLRRGAH
jgi:lipopolysaccharide/colanic/teichoic acid biosynthesis glycosyltransferase